MSGVHLNRVAAVNQLSREIVEGRYTIGEVRERLDEIRVMPGKTKTMQILASGVGSACFCMLFGGNFMDSAAAFVSGVLLYFYVLYISGPHLSKIVGNIGGRCTGDLSLFRDVSAFRRAALEFHDYRFHHASGAGSGVYQRHTGISQMGDYISGSVRMLDALLVFFCIAMGVGLVFSLFRGLTGGVML